MKTQKKFFTCRSCGKEQNLDQSVHINQNYCVSCYNKEQIHRESMMKFKTYIIYLKNEGKFSKIRQKKITDLIRLNEMLLPLTIFQLEDGEIEDALRDMQRSAFKAAMNELKEKYAFSVNHDALTIELISKFYPFFKSRRVSSQKTLDHMMDDLSPFIDQNIVKKAEFFKELKKKAIIPYFTKEKGKYIIKYISPYKLSISYLIQTVKTYRKKIEKRFKQPERFRHFIKVIAQNCQFQTMDDKIKKGIEEYALSISEDEINVLTERMMTDINQAEYSYLIPNIAKYIMDNHEIIFEKWYTLILPFDKSRFMVSQAKTGSRTDFVVRLQYHFRKYELTMITEALSDSTELLMREKSEQKIAKIKTDSSLTEEKKQEKIAKTLERLEKDLIPENLKKTQEENAKGAPIIARFLLINAEKAFNIILDKIIRYHYKRLNITTPVSYITNVLESGAIEKKGELKAFYLIQSREW